MNLAPTGDRAWAGALGAGWVAFSLFLIVTLAGCAPRLPTPEQLAAFHAAGPAQPVLDLKRLAKAKAPTGPCRIVPGDVVALRMRAAGGPPSASRQAAASEGSDPAPTTGGIATQANLKAPRAEYRVVAGGVLELTMPGVLRAVEDGLPQKAAPYVCRVTEAGTVWLPIVGKTSVAGQTLAEIEAALVAAYFPKHVRTRPAVVARVAEHRTFPVSVTGAVDRPGRYALRSDEMSLLTLLMEAGGVGQRGASAFRIRRRERPEPIVVRVKGRDTPADDADLQSGDVVQVDPGLFGEEAPTYRVSEAGMVRLPAVGEVLLAGKTLPEAEAAVAAAYFPQYAADRPTVVAAVAEHHTAAVSIVGAVQMPGTHALRSDELALFALLRKAGGIATEGAAVIRIRRADQPLDAEPLLVPVNETNIPSADVALREGDIVEVERLDDQVITVTGLVNKPGAFPYPPDVQYSLAQALALAGGLNEDANPHYCSVYRKDADGTLLGARFEIAGTTLTPDSSVPVKPADIVVVEHTFWSRWRLFFRRIFHGGLYAGARYDIAR